MVRSVPQELVQPRTAEHSHFVDERVEAVQTVSQKPVERAHGQMRFHVMRSRCSDSSKLCLRVIVASRGFVALILFHVFYINLIKKCKKLTATAREEKVENPRATLTGH